MHVYHGHHAFLIPCVGFPSARYGIFWFFAGWVALMTICVSFLLPETKGVPIAGMKAMWRAHPVWAKFLQSIPCAPVVQLRKW